MAYYIMEIPKRHEKELKQVKSLLSDLRKAKLKCIELCQQLNRDLPQLEQYQILEVKCTRTAENMDKAALIELQTQLAKSLAELYEAERDLMYEADQNRFKKIAAAPPPRRERQYFSKQELGPFKVPTYFNRPQSGLSKVQRISNFIESIGRSMDSLRRSMQSDGPWDSKDFLTYEPEFLALKGKIEQFKMRDEELIHMVERRAKQEIEKLISEGEKVEQDDDHITVRIPRIKVDTFGDQKSEPQKEKRHARSIETVEHQYHPVSMIEPKRFKSTSKKPALERISQEGNEINGNDYLQVNADETGDMDLHITSFQKSNKQYQSRVSKVDTSQMDYDENGNFVYMVRKVSPDSQLNSSIISSISSLRSLRKKVFDDDIWDEFQKL